MATDSTDPGDLETSVAICMWCSNPCDSSWMCGSPECRARQAQELKDLQDGETQYRRQLEWDGLRAAWCKRVNCDDLSLASRWFYAIKLTVCFALSLRYSGPESWPSRVQAGCCFLHGGRSNWSGAWIVVGRGIFTRWWFYVERDGDSDM